MGSPALEEEGIFLNSSNSKLLERAQGILLWVRDTHTLNQTPAPRPKPRSDYVLNKVSQDLKISNDHNVPHGGHK